MLTRVINYWADSPEVLISRHVLWVSIVNSYYPTALSRHKIEGYLILVCVYDLSGMYVRKLGYYVRFCFLLLS